MDTAQRNFFLIVGLFFFLPLTFLLGCSESSKDSRVVPCKELPDSLKIFAKNCPKLDKDTNDYYMEFTYKDIDNYKRNLELKQIKERLDEQESQIELQRRIMIRERLEMEENSNKPVTIFDSNSGQYKNCLRSGDMLS
jgi:hypothetical protein